MKEAMYSNFQQRYRGSTLMLLNEAAFLDPRFQSLLFLSDEDRQTIVSSVGAEVVKLALSNTASSTGSISPMEVENDSDELPLSKKCCASKAEKISSFC